MERILRKWQPLAKPDCWQTGQTYKYFFAACDDAMMKIAMKMIAMMMMMPMRMVIMMRIL